MKSLFLRRQGTLSPLLSTLLLRRGGALDSTLLIEEGKRGTGRLFAKVLSFFVEARCASAMADRAAIIR